LRILGGDGATKLVAGDDVFQQRGVEVLEHREDVPAILMDSALTINPLTGIRGSAIKVIESLMAGRVCVSTEDGARGFLGEGFSGLITVRHVGEMARPIIELLTHVQARRAREAPDPSRLARYLWAHSAQIQRALYDELLRTAA